MHWCSFKTYYTKKMEGKRDAGGLIEKIVHVIVKWALSMNYVQLVVTGEENE